MRKELWQTTEWEKVTSTRKATAQEVDDSCSENVKRIKSKSMMEKGAAWNHHGGVVVRKMMWMYGYEGDHENNDEENREIIADNSTLI